MLCCAARRPSECKSLGADAEVGITNACFSSLYVKYRTEDMLRDDFQKVFQNQLGSKVVSTDPTQPSHACSSFLLLWLCVALRGAVLRSVAALVVVCILFRM